MSKIHLLRSSTGEFDGKVTQIVRAYKDPKVVEVHCAYLNATLKHHGIHTGSPRLGYLLRDAAIAAFKEETREDLFCESTGAYFYTMETELV